MNQPLSQNCSRRISLESSFRRWDNGVGFSSLTPFYAEIVAIIHMHDCYSNTLYHYCVMVKKTFSLQWRFSSCVKFHSLATLIMLVVGVFDQVWNCSSINIVSGSYGIPKWAKLDATKFDCQIDMRKEIIVKLQLSNWSTLTVRLSKITVSCTHKVGCQILPDQAWPMEGYLIPIPTLLSAWVPRGDFVCLWLFTPL